tara:strand:- start:385 stop:1044 length:660 start_codon:yes stop_codon:yes gene_type:complete
MLSADQPNLATKFLTAEDVGKTLNVSRETLARLKKFVDFLLNWQRSINLIGPGTVDNIWHRHVLDCGQLVRYLPDCPGTVLDIGSGAGLPGIILAILGVPNIRMIEADAKKCVFLREAARISETRVEIVEARAEQAVCEPAEIVTARAVAPLSRLLELTEPYIKPNTICFFFKGRNYKHELIDLKNNWKLQMETHRSLTERDGIILKLTSVSRAHVSNA